MPRPDVCLISPYPPSGVRHGGHSGVASYTANLAHALADRGLRVHVVAAELDGDPTHFWDGDVEVTRAFRFGPQALPGAASAARAVGATIVHLQWELFLYGGPASVPGLLPALAQLSPQRRSNAPLVVTLHQVVDPGEIDRGYTRLHRVSAPPVVARTGLGAVQFALRRSATATIVHEASFRNVVRDATVIPLVVEQVTPPDRERSRRELDLDDRLVALCFGFIAPYKGLDAALEAGAAAGPGVQVVVAGGEHPRLLDDTYSSELRERHGSHARFTGWVSEDDVARWFAGADVALFPYPKPFSSSAALAMALAYGTPSLLSPALARCVGAPSGLTAPVEPMALAGRLRALEGPNGEHERRELARWTAALATGRSWNASALRHVELYEEVSSGNRAPRTAELVG